MHAPVCFISQCKKSLLTRFDLQHLDIQFIKEKYLTSIITGKRHQSANFAFKYPVRSTHRFAITFSGTSALVASLQEVVPEVRGEVPECIIAMRQIVETCETRFTEEVLSQVLIVEAEICCLW